MRSGERCMFRGLLSFIKTQEYWGFVEGKNLSNRETGLRRLDEKGKKKE